MVESAGGTSEGKMKENHKHSQERLPWVGRKGASKFKGSEFPSAVVLGLETEAQASWLGFLAWVP